VSGVATNSLVALAEGLVEQRKLIAEIGQRLFRAEALAASRLRELERAARALASEDDTALRAVLESYLPEEAPEMALFDEDEGPGRA
jgi:hypothetical protein